MKPAGWRGSGAVCGAARSTANSFQNGNSSKHPQKAANTMTNPTIEKAARALCRANCGPVMQRDDPEGVELQVENAWDMWTDEVRAVLAAIREPDEAMLVALDNTPDKEWRTGTDHEFWTDLWSIMIDAILKETP